ncbi:hypothetical protein KKG31_01760 [Patescibacteria group bacterium]|nr:hypothetical protein [Patescibacteria group bacterium]MBU1757899.1 hypothetical protein [Patescibacteria group bacterium]
MRLKLSTPKQSVYQGEIKSISLPTEHGIVTITNSNAPMVTSLKP